MIEQGLLSEIRSLDEISTANRNDRSSSPQTAESKIDYTSGYKEFHEYLSAPERSEKAYNAAVERMKVSTRQYAKRQVSWIRNKLLPAVNTANSEEIVTPTYLLDATALGDHWNRSVRDVAVQITEDFLINRELPNPFSLSDNANKMMKIDERAIDPASVLDARKKRICQICTPHPERPFMVEEGREWEAHCKTSRP
ncbi:hypothetical protein FPV67DRAFT_39894 [Lyophyllum atratum]|nr:hypothetical protein FPV67DRAFT_39894 [Lyophyllum atratum]